MILYFLYGVSLFVTACITLYIARLCSLVSRIRSRRRRICNSNANPKPEPVLPARDCNLMVVLGSGGHTAEMLTLVQEAVSQTKRPTRVVYVVGRTDSHSAVKAAVLHAGAPDGNLQDAKFTFHTLPRSREVGQSWLSSVYTTARSAKVAMQVVAMERPDLVLCNGPGTSAVVAFCALLLRAWVGGEWGRVVYVESFARVTTLSLSGKLVYPFADRFLVQWAGLTRYEMAEFYGRLC